MDILYKRQTSEGKLVLIWEDGLVTSDQGYQIPTIGKKKLSPRLLNLFSGEVQLFTFEELWSLFQACREAAASGEAPVPGHIRKRALDLLSNHIPA